MLYGHTRDRDLNHVHSASLAHEEGCALDSPTNHLPAWVFESVQDFGQGPMKVSCGQALR